MTEKEKDDDMPTVQKLPQDRALEIMASCLEKDIKFNSLYIAVSAGMSVGESEKLINEFMQVQIEVDKNINLKGVV